MNGFGDNHKLLVIAGQLRKSVLAEIAGMSLFPVNNQNCAADFMTVLQNRHIHKGLTACYIPAAVGVEASRMIAALSFVVVVK